MVRMVKHGMRLLREVWSLHPWRPCPVQRAVFSPALTRRLDNLQRSLVNSTKLNNLELGRKLWDKNKTKHNTTVGEILYEENSALRCCSEKRTQELSKPLSSASPDLSANLACLKQRSKTVTERICQGAWKMKDRITVSNRCLVSPVKLCHSFPSGWHRYTLCTEKQCPCYNFCKVVSAHTLSRFSLAGCQLHMWGLVIFLLKYAVTGALPPLLPGSALASGGFALELAGTGSIRHRRSF